MEAKYDQIGTGYNTTRRADPYLTASLLRHLQQVQGAQYLDIGCGTGNYTVALAAGGHQFIGIDPSETMLVEARKRHPEGDWRLGQAESLAMETDSVDGIIASLTLHHWRDLGAGFQELGRVIKSGGRMVILTSTPEQMQGYWLNTYFPRIMERSLAQMPSFADVTGAALPAGFEVVYTETYDVRPDLSDLFLQSGKRRPEMYFRPEVRAGISTFAALSNREEVEAGLAKLREDLDSGKWQEVQRSYSHDRGDYLFVVLEKS